MTLQRKVSSLFVLCSVTACAGIFMPSLKSADHVPLTNKVGQAQCRPQGSPVSNLYPSNLPTCEAVCALPGVFNSEQYAECRPTIITKRIPKCIPDFKAPEPLCKPDTRIEDRDPIDIISDNRQDKYAEENKYVEDGFTYINSSTDDGISDFPGNVPELTCKEGYEEENYRNRWFSYFGTEYDYPELGLELCSTWCNPTIPEDINGLDDVLRNDEFTDERVFGERNRRFAFECQPYFERPIREDLFDDDSSDEAVGE